MTKLEFGALALLWCEGSQEQKAQFFYWLVKPSLNEDQNDLKLVL